MTDQDLSPRYYEIPASRHIQRARTTETGVVAMQKVEGSNPFSRFNAIPLQIGILVFGEIGEI